MNVFAVFWHVCQRAFLATTQHEHRIWTLRVEAPRYVKGRCLLFVYVDNSCQFNVYIQSG